MFFYMVDTIPFLCYNTRIATNRTKQMRIWLVFLGNEELGAYPFPEEYTRKQVREVLINWGADPRIRTVPAHD